MKRRQLLTTFALGALGSAQVARSQVTGGDRTIRIVVGFPPGGSTDTIARTIGSQLERVLKATVIVENKPGAGARIANTYVKNAKPDGNTLLLTSSSLMAVYPHVFKTLGYDPLKDYVPVTSVVDMDFGYVASVQATPGINSLGDYVQWVKSNPANGNYGGVGIGSIPHFLGFLLARSAGVKMNYVPFNGAAPHLQALEGGQLPFGVDVVAGIVPHLPGGRIKLLATTGTERVVPNVPTVREAGFSDLATVDYTGFFYPAGTPAEFVQQIQAAVKVGLQQPSVQDVFRGLALKPSGAETSQFARRVQTDYEKWRKVVEDADFKRLD